MRRVARLLPSPRFEARTRKFAAGRARRRDARDMRVDIRRRRLHADGQDIYFNDSRRSRQVTIYHATPFHARPPPIHRYIDWLLPKISLLDKYGTGIDGDFHEFLDLRCMSIDCLRS